MISERTVHRSLFGAVAGAAVVIAVGCGSSYPAPTQPLADVEAAGRSAEELGAANVPAAQLHLKLAQEQTTNARKLMQDGENKRAESMLIRAKADAELALSLAKEEKAKSAVSQAAEKSNLQNQVIQGQGAAK